MPSLTKMSDAINQRGQRVEYFDPNTLAGFIGYCTVNDVQQDRFRGEARACFCKAMNDKPEGFEVDGEHFDKVLAFLSAQTYQDAWTVGVYPFLKIIGEWRRQLQILYNIRPPTLKVVMCQKKDLAAAWDANKKKPRGSNSGAPETTLENAVVTNSSLTPFAGPNTAKSPNNK